MAKVEGKQNFVSSIIQKCPDNLFLCEIEFSSVNYNLVDKIR